MGVVSAIAAVISVAQSAKQRKEASKARREQRAVNRAQALRQRQQQIREARVKRAQAVNQAFISGGEGSTLSGATSSVGSQLGGNLGFNQSTLRRSERAAGFQDKADLAGFRSQAFASLSTTSLEIDAAARQAGGYSQLFGFDKKKPAPVTSVS